MKKCERCIWVLHVGSYTENKYYCQYNPPKLTPTIMSELDERYPRVDADWKCHKFEWSVVDED